ncbi:MerR family transcriptional regulator [Actinoplanes sp. NPDC051851]|uniref:MerR family transcriptional regulator n=1 Tax=Actinoplanes sp. NPDC051851 TaxID=3154753 RepID=UPI0034157084
MTVATEETRVLHLFQRVASLEAVAHADNLRGEQRRDILDAVRQAVRECEPVRITIAAQLLNLSRKTVEAWVREGLLTVAAGNHKRLVLDPERLHEVLHLVRDLRSRGRDRNLIEAVWYRLNDQALTDREDFTESIEQMQRGEGRIVRSGEAP